jgi:hypothetical protein
MNHETAKDYLGHPCRFTQAKEHFADSFDCARKMEARQIKRQVGARLLELKYRIEHAHNASRAICDMPHTDEDQTRALLEMLSAYEEKTADIFYDLAGLVLTGFEGSAPATQGDVQ